MKILIVDDQISILSFLEVLLNAAGHSPIAFARDYQEALILLGKITGEIEGKIPENWDTSTPPDIILMDEMMPEMSGAELTKLLRSDEAFSSTTIIFLTALAQEDHQEKAMLAGAQGYIRKPFNRADFLKEITSIRAEHNKQFASSLDN